MAKEKPEIYDPSPVDIELQLLGNIGIENMQAADLSRPEVVRLLVHNHRMTLSKLKAAETKINNTGSDNARLTQDREDLRIQVAQLQERGKISLLEIPISILSGFAINMLVVNFRNGVAWLLLIVSLIMLLFLRLK